MHYSFSTKITFLGKTSLNPVYVHSTHHIFGIRITSEEIQQQTERMPITKYRVPGFSPVVRIGGWLPSLPHPHGRGGGGTHSLAGTVTIFWDFLPFLAF
jgi:hypothetical protein